MIFLGTRAFFDPGKFEEISLQYQNLTQKNNNNNKIMWAKNLKLIEWVLNYRFPLFMEPISLVYYIWETRTNKSADRQSS